MEEKNKITVSEANKLIYRETSIQKMIAEATSMGNIFDSLGIIEASFKEGGYYYNNIRKGIRTFSSEGIILEEKSNTYNITMLKERYKENGVINELEDNKTQKVIGSFINKKQPTVSIKKSKIK